MIEAKDLRIGNIVRRPAGCGEYNIVVVEDIQEDCINQDEIAAYGCPPSNWFKTEGCIEGIPLSEEWLIKFGFEKRAYNLILFQKNGFYLQHDGIVFLLKEGGLRIVIESVHQLQNLYYALTGTDLELHPQ